jgi:N-acetyl-beta-hexosaminidase
MEAIAEKKITIHVTLMEDEARILKDMVQNQIYEDETQTQRGFREMLFDRLRKALEG